jgi:hypothetical protein
VSLLLTDSDAQRSSVWRSMAKASAERPDFAERQRTLECRAPSNSTFLNIRNTVKMFFHYKKLIFIKYNLLHKNFYILI